MIKLLPEVIVSLPVDKMCNVTIDHRATFIFRDIEQIWVTEREDVITNTLLGRYMVRVQEKNGSHSFEFCELADAIEFHDAITYGFTYQEDGVC